MDGSGRGLIQDTCPHMPGGQRNHRSNNIWRKAQMITLDFHVISLFL